MKFVFDVESNGLHGAGFAVGWVVITPENKICSTGYLRCPIVGKVDPWVAKNVIPKLDPENCKDAVELRNGFWKAWIKAKEQGATAWADCGFPVESNFLSACVHDNLTDRKWDAPYPLHDVATVFHVCGTNPMLTMERLRDEDEHHPTGDARQSARLLIETLALFNLQHGQSQR